LKRPVIRSSALRALAAGLLLALGSAQAQAPGDVRVALVIGNSAYSGAPLTNPANDAQAMSKALRGMGFEVTELRDAQRPQMVNAIRQLRDKLAGRQAVVMLYYAGHGLQIDWHNYMVPVDAKLASAAQVQQEAVDLDQVFDVLKAANSRMNIVVLDACRDNPFAGSTTGKGLAQMDAPNRTFLAYATAPGNVAADGEGSNGLYTEHLLKEMQRPAVKIEDIFKRVRLGVRVASAGRQIPWESTSLEDDFYFQPTAPSASARATDQEADLNVELEGWLRIRNSTNPQELTAYLQRFPSGRFAELAQFRLDQISAPVIQAQARQGQAATLASGVNRYQVGDVLVRSVQDLVAGGGPQRRRVEVTYADNDRVEFNQGKALLQFDQMGNVLRNQFGTHEPGILKFPADIALGKRWRTAYRSTNDNGTVTAYWDFRVVASEKVTVGAGTYQALRVEGKGESNNKGQFTQTYWVDPQTLIEIKGEVKFMREGRVTAHQLNELVSYTRAPRPPAPATRG